MMSAETLAPMVAKLARRSCLDEEARAHLLALPHSLRKIEARQHIVRQGDRARHSALLLDGFAYRHKIVGDGGRQIVSVHMKGDLVDLQNSFLNAADHNVQTLTDALVAFVPRDAIAALAAQNAQIGMALWIDTLVDGSIFREWIANVGRRDARMRTAHILCEFAVRLEAAGLSQGPSYGLPMTQEQLADVLGLTPIHVNRTLKGLERDGLIARDKRSLRITNRARLAAVGDFSDQYLHLEKQSVSLVAAAQ
ncbi:Crp/Fnr family transcriptional regulator [Sphingosinicella rhizophila]|uniref:Crp/Fnr family transcriptional regulator n=1 Tax=Sphingosinicella rhizophila TaxID=3050082 RepID=A0ABU3Q6U5_9SPHN|nr:Crp/Fnr family transcriptional regulator [Sphingosinicella sp. GR2756]MDT9599111.1 Crp/Fnr family transcriptional regulator [Sphingosinicella sp. GR2756]